MGISSAILLKQRGFKVSIYDCRDNVSTGDGEIIIWPNASYILSQFGVLDKVLAIAGQPKNMQRLSQNNENLSAINITTINSQMGYPSLSILRQDIQSILISRLAALDMPIQYQHQVSQIETTSSGQADVYFTNGTQVSSDIVIGADGRMASPSCLMASAMANGWRQHLPLQS